ATADVGFRFIGGLVALLDFESDLVGATMLGTAQRANGTGDGGIHVGTRAGDHTAGKGRGVEFVLGVENQRGVHGTDPFIAGFFAVQQTQEVAADGIVVRFYVDHPAVVAEVVPVEQ